MHNRPVIALIAGVLLIAFGLTQWFEDLGMLRDGVEVTGQFTGTRDARNYLFPEMTRATRLHPHVIFDLPGGGTATLALHDDMPAEAFADTAPRDFLYVAGPPQVLRLPEKVSPWGNAVIWWSLGIGILATVGGAMEVLRARAAARA